MTITLCIEDHFDAAHFLPNYDGPCADLHGHTWIVRAYYEGSVNCETGMVEDFKTLKLHLLSVIEQFDHKCINRLLSENGKFSLFPNPTAEILATYILNTLRVKSLNWRRVRLYESPHAYVEVRA